MNYIIAHLMFSFFASASFGIIFNAPRKSLIQCGLVGMIGWITYIYLVDIEVDVVQASFVGSFAVAIVGHVMAKLHKMPIIIFSVAGIIPLVPGGLSYDTMRHVVSNNYLEAIPLAAKAFTISGAIAMGLVFGEILVLLFRRNPLKKARSNRH